MSIRRTKTRSHVVLIWGDLFGQGGWHIKKKITHWQGICSYATSALLNFHQARVITMLGSEGLAGSLGKSFKMSRNVQAPIVLKWNRGLLDYLLQGTLAVDQWKTVHCKHPVLSTIQSTTENFVHFRIEERIKKALWVHLMAQAMFFLLSMCFHSQSTRNLIF